MSETTGDRKVSADLVRDDHLSRLATWVLNTLGKALAFAIAAPIAAALVAAVSGEPAWIWVGVVIAPLVFALVLYTADAPRRIGPTGD